MFAELMAHGDEAERDASKGDDISPLFMGGMEYRIHSIAAVACALNGNSSFDMLSDPDFDLSSVKVPWWSRYFGKRMYDQLQTETDGRDSRDCGDDDMQIDQALLLNERMSTLRMYIIIRSRAATRKRRVTDLYPKKHGAFLC